MVLNIPDGSAFSDLELTREPGTGRWQFARVPLIAICIANGLDAEAALADDNFARGLIREWYRAHCKAGGSRDALVEEMLEESNAFLNPQAATLPPSSR